MKFNRNEAPLTLQATYYDCLNKEGKFRTFFTHDGKPLQSGGLCRSSPPTLEDSLSMPYSAWK